MNTQISARNDYLKIIAIITMLIDHIGYMFFPNIMLFRTIGRIAFPIYAYSIAAGYKFTSNRRKYALRLFVFALISYVPYIYFNFQIEPKYFRFNVLFLLLAGIGAIALWNAVITRLRPGSRQSANAEYFKGLLLLIVFLIYLFTPKIISAVLMHLGIDFGLSYGTYGLFLIMIFYWFYNRPVMGLISFIALSFGDAFITSFAAYQPITWSNCWWTSYATALGNFIQTDWRDILIDELPTMTVLFFQARAVIGVVIVYALKPIDARLNLNKYFFYWFYPVHIAVIILVYAFIFKQ